MTPLAFNRKERFSGSTLDLKTAIGEKFAPAT